MFSIFQASKYQLVVMHFKVIILFLPIVWLARCVFNRRKGDTIHKFHRTGEAIAVDNLIQKYEKEHHKFYTEEIGNGNHLLWPALANKNLSEYCRKYLRLSIPERNTDDAIGIRIKKILHYGIQNTNTTSEVVVVHCTVKHQYVYYLTRSPEPNCAYSLKSQGHQRHLILTIINKYCDFEDKLLISRSLKRKRTGMVLKLHRNTGQPIAKDEYLLKYEFDHHELLQREGGNGECIEWPYAKAHPNLNFYCYQYMGVSVPTRNREGVEGRWKPELLHHQKMNSDKYVKITVVTCQTAGLYKVNYHITRALKTNCVFALLRENSNVHASLVIIYKHCDFEEPDDQQLILLDHKVEMSKYEVKEETFGMVGTLQLFPSD